MLKVNKNILTRILLIGAILSTAASLVIFGYNFYCIKAIDKTKSNIDLLSRNIEAAELTTSKYLQERNDLMQSESELKGFLSEFGELNMQPNSQEMINAEIERLSSENFKYIQESKLLLLNNQNYLGIHFQSDNASFDLETYVKDKLADTAKGTVKDITVELTEAALGTSIISDALTVKDNLDTIESIKSLFNTSQKQYVSSTILNHLSQDIMDNNVYIRDFLINESVDLDAFTTCIQHFEYIVNSYNTMSNEGANKSSGRLNQVYSQLLENYERYRANLSLIDNYKEFNAK